VCNILQVCGQTRQRPNSMQCLGGLHTALCGKCLANLLMAAGERITALCSKRSPVPEDVLVNYAMSLAMSLIAAGAA